MTLTQDDYMNRFSENTGPSLTFETREDVNDFGDFGKPDRLAKTAAFLVDARSGKQGIGA